MCISLANCDLGVVLKGLIWCEIGSVVCSQISLKVGHFARSGVLQVFN